MKYIFLFFRFVISRFMSDYCKSSLIPAILSMLRLSY